jgi:protein required for attachment to host cells
MIQIKARQPVPALNAVSARRMDMARPLTLWIAIADGEHARFVSPDGDNTLRTVTAMDSASAHLRSRDIGSDRPGRSFESASATRHAVGERTDPHQLEKVRFAALVAERLNAAATEGDFDELVLVAPPRTLHELRDALDGAAMQKLIGTLERDLVKTPDHELSAHVREWVNPTRRA